MFGLGSGNSSASYSDVEFAWYLGTQGQLSIYEYGTRVQTVGTYRVGDRLEVRYVRGRVRYYQNGTLRYTSSRPPVYPVSLDTSIYTPGGSLRDAYLVRPGALPTPTRTPTATPSLTR